MAETESVFLSGEWRYLVMLNYEMDPAALLPYVPAGVELDEWNGCTFASMVGFMFLGTRLLGLPIPFHQNFEEVNLRFYVRRKAEDGWRRGVVFVKEIVPRWAIATVAQVVYNEKYAALPMRHEIELTGNKLRPNGRVEYGWKHAGVWDQIVVQTAGEAQPAGEGSQEEFITEHYWGYAAQRKGGTVEYQVAHPRWNVWQVQRATLDCDVRLLYGPEFAESLAAPPRSAFVADGSAITVHRGRRL